MIQIIGFVALATGATFLAFAYNSTNAPLEQLSNTMTGRYSGETMWYFAVGMAAVGSVKANWLEADRFGS